MTLQPGTLLQGRYQIRKLLSDSQNSTVYLAEDKRLGGRLVAVKQVKLGHLAATEREAIVDQFWKEARFLAELNHPGIVQVTDFFAENDHHYLVMEYVAGETVNELLTRQPAGRVSLEQALDLVEKIGDVLTYLHTWQDHESGQVQPIIYRDLKPSNVLVQADGQVRLLDFGIARFFKPGQQGDTVALGTPGYAAPEQYGSEQQSDPRTDVYSLGVLLHQMVTGHNPALSPMNLLAADELNPMMPPKMARAIEQAVRLDPSQRFASVRAFLNALGASSTASVPSVLPVASSRGQDGRRLRQWLPLLAVGALPVLVAFLFFRDQFAAVQATPTALIVFITATPPPSSTPEMIPSPSATPTASQTPTVTNSVTPTETPTEAPSPTSTPSPTPAVQFGDVHFCWGEPCQLDYSNELDTFPGGITRIYTEWSYANIPPNAHYERIWLSNGEVYVHYDCTWTGPPGGVETNVILLNTRGLRSGEWQLIIRINEEEVLRESITLTGNHMVWTPVGVFDSCYGVR